ncbi:hypothetical protein [Rhizobium sp. BK491]|uniref:hypothetical protein n=1 Tax=Rhizobium sp. BK491 TaxID=2587009 RepID=UPI001616FF1F|nr:hypothetical protein [Rhizobium sp. BK491]MBB3571861.1 hypothetical protein [Rhizobium sp. BK491]
MKKITLAVSAIICALASVSAHAGSTTSSPGNTKENVKTLNGQSSKSEPQKDAPLLKKQNPAAKGKTK